MGKTSLKGWRRIAAAVMVALTLAAPTPSYATWPVIDTAGLTAALETKAEIMKEIKLFIDQIKILTDSLNFLKDIKGVITDVSDAIGDLTTITLPITSLPSLKNQALENWRCLTDFGKLTPGIEFEDIDFGSLCDARSAVRASVFLDPTNLSTMPQHVRYDAIKKMQQQREQIYANASAEALAAALAAQKKTLTDMIKTFDQLQSAARSAQTVQQHLAVGNQIQLARYQGEIDRYSLEINLLRLLAARGVREVSVTAIIPETTE
jgi:hypothetical protein